MKYKVLLSRTETAEVEVEAASQKEARQLALRRESSGIEMKWRPRNAVRVKGIVPVREGV